METTRAVAVQLSSWPCRTLLALLGGNPADLPYRRCGIPLMLAGLALLYAAASGIWLLGTSFIALLGANGFVEFGWGFSAFLVVAAGFFLVPIHTMMPRRFQRTVVPAVGILFLVAGAFVLASDSDLDILIFGGWLAICGAIATIYWISLLTQRQWRSLYDRLCPPVTYI